MADDESYESTIPDLRDPVREALRSVLDDRAAAHRRRARVVHPRARRTPTPRRSASRSSSIRGSVHEVGDSETTFTIQSVSKPFVFALALEQSGLAEVIAHVGRRAERRAVQRDQPRARHRPAAEPADQRGRDRHELAHRGRHRRGEVRVIHAGLNAFAGARARPRRVGVRVRARDRRPQPRPRLPHPVGRHARLDAPRSRPAPTSGSARSR